MRARAARSVVGAAAPRRGDHDRLRGAVVLLDRHGRVPRPWRRPLHFFFEHVDARRPGGIEGLRLPSSCSSSSRSSSPSSFARELAGEQAALLTPLLLAVAPLGISLATFARMYSLFVAAVLGATLLALLAGRSGKRGDWIVAGAVIGALVYVHPRTALLRARRRHRPARGRAEPSSAPSTRHGRELQWRSWSPRRTRTRSQRSDPATTSGSRAAASARRRAARCPRKRCTR